MPSKKNKYIDWITMFLLIANSANPFFYLSIEMLSASFVILLALWFFKGGESPSLNRYFYIYIFFIIGLQLAQSVVYGYADWPWMEEDRDLDAIRKEADYARIVEGLRRQYPPIVRTPSSGLAPPSSEPTPGPPRNPPPPLPPLPTPTK